MGARLKFAAAGVGMTGLKPKVPDSLPAGVWRELLPHAFALVDEIAAHGIADPFWTFGGGTVLMLRYGHRLSKDIDIFVPDPQYLGFVSPRLSEVAEGISDQYVEGPGYIKLLRPEGEIDFVASPNLTADAFDVWEILGRQVRVETATEIVAKKLWHRGDRASARDLFDLALVIEREPAALALAAPYLLRHRTAFLRQVDQRQTVLKAQFDAIDRLDFALSYTQAAAAASAFLMSL